MFSRKRYRFWKDVNENIHIEYQETEHIGLETFAEYIEQKQMEPFMKSKFKGLILYAELYFMEDNMNWRKDMLLRQKQRAALLLPTKEMKQILEEQEENKYRADLGLCEIEIPCSVPTYLNQKTCIIHLLKEMKLKVNSIFHC